jgi:chaperone modulatory protein CbpM
MSERDIVVAAAVLEDACLTIEQFCTVCAIDQQWIVRHVEEGLFPAPGTAAGEWRFSSAHLRRAQRMHALERDFDAAPELAALMADLLEEMDELRARLRRAGLG